MLISFKLFDVSLFLFFLDILHVQIMKGLAGGSLLHVAYMF